MFWAGESVTLPDACELEVRLRVEEPAVAVIVTCVALDICHVRVTLWPGLIIVALAEKTRLGGFDFALFEPQAHRPHKASGTIPEAIQRKLFLFIFV